MKPVKEERIVYIVSKTQTQYGRTPISDSLSKVFMMIMQERVSKLMEKVFVFVEEGVYEESGPFEQFYHLANYSSNSQQLNIVILPVSSQLLKATLERDLGSYQLVCELSAVERRVKNFVKVKLASYRSAMGSGDMTKPNLRMHVREIDFEGEDWTNVDFMGDANFIFEKCTFQKLRIHTLSSCNLLLSENVILNTMITATEHSKIMASGNQFHITEQDEQVFAFHIRDQSTVDIDDNSFDLENIEESTAIWIDVSFQPGFGCHVHIQNNTISNCSYGIICVPDMASIQKREEPQEIEYDENTGKKIYKKPETDNLAQISSQFHHSIQIRENVIQQFKNHGIKIAAVNLRPNIQRNLIRDPILLESSLSGQVSGIVLCAGSKCNVTHNEIIGTPYLCEEYTIQVQDRFHFNGILIYDNQTSPELLFNIITKCKYGVNCLDQCTPAITENNLSENNTTIDVSQGAHATIRTNIIKDTVDCGIAVHKEGFAKITSNVFMGSGDYENIYLTDLGTSAIILDNEIKQGRNGISVTKLASAFVQRNKITHMSKEGVNIFDSGIAYIFDNVIASCGESGIYISEQLEHADINEVIQLMKQMIAAVQNRYYDNVLKRPGMTCTIIESNQIHDNTIGVVVENCGAFLLDNHIYSNKEYNTLIQFAPLFFNVTNNFGVEHFQVVLENNKIYEGHKWGVAILIPTDLGVPINIHNNMIHDCLEGALAISADARQPITRLKPSILIGHNQLHSTKKGHNIRVFDNSVCQLTGNKIFNSEDGHGIEIGLGAYCIVKENQIFKNRHCGVYLYDIGSAAEFEANIIYENYYNISIENTLCRGIMIANNQIHSALSDNINLRFRHPDIIRKKNPVARRVTIHKNRIQNARGHGISIEPYSDVVSVTKNSFHRNGISELHIGSAVQYRPSHIRIVENSFGGPVSFSESPAISTIDGLHIANNIFMFQGELTNASRFIGGIDSKSVKKLEKANKK